MKDRCALVTGFEPFDQGTLNPSWLAVQALPDRIGSYRIIKARLPVSFTHAFPALEREIAACSPDLVLCLGLAAKRAGLSLERVAINVDDARIPDNEGRQPIDQAIDPSAPNAYFSTLPHREILARLVSADLPATISETAGTYVCNHVLFRLLHLIAWQRPGTMGGFVHVPALPDMLGPEATVPGMPLGDMVRGVTIAIETCSDLAGAARPPASRLDLRPYDPGWPQAFADIHDQLRTGLGDLAVRIDHIGSTAVPGLAAKDVIDIQITVNALDDKLLAAMAGLGYSRAEGVLADHVPPGGSDHPLDWQKWFFRPPAGQRRTNTHVRIAGRANQRFALLFRDFLRAHPTTAQAYGELKRRLAAHLADVTRYPEVKDPAVDLIIFHAEKWADETGWQC